MAKSNLKYGTEEFSEFLTEFQKRVSKHPLSNKTFHGQIEKEMPGLFNLLESFSASAMNPNLPETRPEWNPFSQRPYLPHLDFAKDPSILVEFSKAVNAVSNFIETSHEATHILLWEPLFTGFYGPRSPKEFAEISISFEAFCFWYADIVVSRSLRVRLSDGEFVKTRDAVSQPDFHPYRAFKAMKIHQPSKILDIYLQAFQGGETPLYRHRKQPFVADLGRRFLGFYLENKAPSRLLYHQLGTLNYFGEFRNRFCKLAGIPTLLPRNILDMNIGSDAAAYCHAIWKSGFKHMAKMSENEIARLRLRRFIQTRAYEAYSILCALELGQVFSRKNRTIDFPLLKYELNHYINVLETGMQGLCKNTNLEQLKRLCRRGDQMYSAKVRAYFKKNDIWMSKRTLIFPRLKAKGSFFGILEKNQKVSKPEIRELNKLLMIKFCNPKIENTVTSKSLSARRASHNLIAFMAANAHLSDSWTKANEEKWKSAFNELLLTPGTLKSWSVRLSDIDPENNVFRDPLFIYE